MPVPDLDVSAPASLPVEAGKVAELRRATGLPGGSPVAPPTFTVVVDHHGPSIAALVADAGFDLGRVLHGVEHIRYPGGPLLAGDELAGEVRLVGHEHRDGSSGPLELLHFRTVLRRPDGEVAAEVDRTLVVIATGAAGATTPPA